MTIRFLADENLDNDILRGLARRVVVDVVRVQDLGMAGVGDVEVLARASDEQRVLLTHDVTTMVAHAWARVAAGLAMPGVVVVPQLLAVVRAIDDLVLLHQLSEPGERRALPAPLTPQQASPRGAPPRAGAPSASRFSASPVGFECAH